MTRLCGILRIVGLRSVTSSDKCKVEEKRSKRVWFLFIGVECIVIRYMQLVYYLPMYVHV